MIEVYKVTKVKKVGEFETIEEANEFYKTIKQQQGGEYLTYESVPDKQKLPNEVGSLQNGVQ